MPALDDSEEGEHGADGEDSSHFPPRWPRADNGVVEGDEHDRHVVEQREKDDHCWGEDLHLVDDHDEHDEDHDVDGHGNAVIGVAHHAHKGAARLLDAADDDGESGGIKAGIAFEVIRAASCQVLTIHG